MMTFNLRMDTVDDGENAWPHRKEKVLQTIYFQNPDILSIQEGLYHMVDYLSNQLPAYTVIGTGRDGGTAGEYNAIFYKKEKLFLKQQGQFWLSETPNVSGSKSWGCGCSRICTWGEFMYVNCSSDTFHIFNTHLDNASQLARLKGSEVIMSQIKPLLQKDASVLLTGDLNCGNNNEVIKCIEEGGMKNQYVKGNTFHDFLGGETGEQIDYIFLSCKCELKKITVDRRSFNGRYPSDHYPVIANVNIHK